MRLRRLFLLVSLIGGMAAAMLWAACTDDECEEGETRCRGREVMTCERASCHDPSCAFGGQGNRWWKVETCEHECVAPERFPFCALSSEPDPRCAPGNGAYCDGTDAVSCFSGFATRREPCAESGRVCVISDWFEAICALSSRPNPACREIGRPDAKLCDGADLIACNGSHVTSIRTCSAACVAPEPSEAFCAAESEPDSRCAPGSFGSGIACPGDAPARCNSGYVECLEPIPESDADAGSN
jgi:hypothetical protein